MKKQLLHIIFVVLLNGLFVGCDKSIKDEEDDCCPENGLIDRVFSETFVEMYVPIPDYVYYGSATHYHRSKILDGTWTNSIDILFIVKGEEYIHPKNKNKDLFNALSQYHGDVYNQYYPRYTYMYWSVLAEGLLSIDITSTLDFGPDYPAGTSLKEIAKFTGTTPYPHIKSKYTTPELYTPVVKLLSELTPEDMILLWDKMNIEFTRTAPAGKHTFTITYVTKDMTLPAHTIEGRTIVHTFDMKF